MSVRVRFAPSPTGPLHIGGVRTALYNYLFARKMGGSFVLRIEDTDQNRFVEGAEKYILDALNWCGIHPDEGPGIGGTFGPYRQSERKSIYQEHATMLVEKGSAYYAFDTPEALTKERAAAESRKEVFQYNVVTRSRLTNSLSMTDDEVKRRLDAGEPYVIRMNIPEDTTVQLNDIVRGDVQVHSSEIDDKILMKADGMPTYHLANIVDDHLMQITHVIRGEEWLPSAPLHVLLYESFGWTPPIFAHLPLLLKPDGKGKLSKRDGVKGGYPVFPLEWSDPTSGEVLMGFRESGFLPAAMVNFLALLGWNPGTEEELFDMVGLEKSFELTRVNKSGARFDLQKAEWFNQHYLKELPVADLERLLRKSLEDSDIQPGNVDTTRVAEALRERITFPAEFARKGAFFFVAPDSYDQKVVRKKWNAEIAQILAAFAEQLHTKDVITAEEARGTLEDVLVLYNTGLGRVMQPLRVTITGEAGGPDLMETISILGPKEAAQRINHAILQLKDHEKADN